MVDRRTGYITLSKTVQIKPNDTFDTIEALTLGEVQQVSDMQTGWKWLTVKNLPVDQQYVIISFGFYNNALKKLDLLVAKEWFDLTLGWESWSEANERKILVELRRWLLDELGREGNFTWGEASATYDPKGGSSSIRISYNEC